MAALYELIPASFRGVHFLVPSGTAEGGRHAIKHEYPDASTRYVEDNGRCVPDFKLKCVVHGPSAIGRLKQLQAALDAPGPGTLIHPLYGRQFVQVLGPYSLKHDDNTVGVYEIDVTFAVTGPPSFPGIVTGIAAAITNISAANILSMFNAFTMGIPVLSAATVGIVGGVIGSAVSILSNAFGAVSAVRMAAGAITNDVNYLLSEPARLGSQLNALVRAPFNAVDTVTAPELWGGYLDLADHATAIAAQAAAINPTTADLIVRQNTLILTAATLGGVAFTALAEAAAGKTYRVADEVADDITTLTDVYEQMVDLLEFAPSIRLSTQSLLAEIAAVLAAKRVTLPNVVPLKVYEMPASVMAYMLYDTADDLETIIGLNAGKSPILYDGEVLTLHA